MQVFFAKIANSNHNGKIVCVFHSYFEGWKYYAKKIVFQVRIIHICFIFRSLLLTSKRMPAKYFSFNQKIRKYVWCRQRNIKLRKSLDIIY